MDKEKSKGWRITIGESGMKSEVWFDDKKLGNVTKIEIEVAAGEMSRARLHLVGVNVEASPHEVEDPLVIGREGKWG